MAVMRHLWKRFYSSANRRKWMTIKEVLSSSNKTSNQLVVTQGWIKSVRQQKNMLFIDINDGSCLNNLQAISPVDKLNLYVNDWEGHLINYCTIFNNPI
jgi:aspartyl/asparaginyl-tRNA synthetase